MAEQTGSKPYTPPKVPKRRAWTRAERDQADIDIFEEGGSAYEVTRNGKRYRFTKDGLIPVEEWEAKKGAGQAAQATVKKKRKAKSATTTK
jgi:Zn-dependent peptidase ImmA (M78 family)